MARLKYKFKQFFFFSMQKEKFQNMLHLHFKRGIDFCALMTPFS